MITAVTTHRINTAYLDCLGCGVVLYGYKGALPPQTLCADCRKFAALASAAHCPQCGSSAVLCCTERTGFETLFCATCDHVWCSASSSVREIHEATAFSNRVRWTGVERRRSSLKTGEATVAEFRKTG